MSTTLLIPFVGMCCVAVAALLLSPNPFRTRSRVRLPDCLERAERLVTDDEIDSARDAFVRSHGLITAVRVTGGGCGELREVELDLMVSRPGGGQFPVHEAAVIPARALGHVSPGSVVVAYFRPGDESSVSVCVPPA